MAMINDLSVSQNVNYYREHLPIGMKPADTYLSMVFFLRLIRAGSAR